MPKTFTGVCKNYGDGKQKLVAKRTQKPFV